MRERGRTHTVLDLANPWCGIVSSDEAVFGISSPPTAALLTCQALCIYLNVTTSLRHFPCRVHQRQGHAAGTNTRLSGRVPAQRRVVIGRDGCFCRRLCYPAETSAQHRREGPNESISRASSQVPPTRTSRNKQTRSSSTLAGRCDRLLDAEARRECPIIDCRQGPKSGGHECGYAFLVSSLASLRCSFLFSLLISSNSSTARRIRPES